MLSYVNSERKLVILLHEIYGINAHIESVAKEFVQRSYDVLCPNFLASNTVFSYEEEEMAYRNFMDTCSFEECAMQVDELIRKVAHKYEFITVVGFSVGATVAWLCSTNRLCDAVVGFYGSRIRDYTFIEPSCKTLLVLPKEETSFNVRELIDALYGMEEVSFLQLDGKHGFADTYAPNYEYHVANRASDDMYSFLEEVSYLKE